MGNNQSTTICYESVSNALIERLPELREMYQTELGWWDDEKPGPHVVYGDILNPYIEHLLQKGDDRTLRRVFEFIEELSSSEDARVQELVAVTVCENLGSDEQRLRAARCYMGPMTLKHCNDVEKFWNGVKESE